MLKEVFLDLETGGLQPNVNPVLQLAGEICINGSVKEEFDIKLQPGEKYVDPGALKVQQVSADDLYTEDRLTQQEGFLKFISILDKYVDRYNSADKYYIIGYNFHKFDQDFLRAIFNDHSNNYYGSYFWNPPIDVMLLAAYACIGQRHKLPNFKLATVAQSLGVQVEEGSLHDAKYDVHLTKSIYRLFQSEYP